MILVKKSDCYLKGDSHLGWRTSPTPVGTFALSRKAFLTYYSLYKLHIRFGYPEIICVGSIEFPLIVGSFPSSRIRIIPSY